MPPVLPACVTPPPCDSSTLPRQTTKTDTDVVGGGDDMPLLSHPAAWLWYLPYLPRPSPLMPRLMLCPPCASITPIQNTPVSSDQLPHCAAQIPAAPLAHLLA